MKGNSELAAKKHFGEDRTLIIRPTYMIGPGDKLDRFIHWPVRISRGGDVLVPGKLDDPVQFIDVRQVAQWMIRMAENKAMGAYNAVGPEQTMTVAGFSEEIKSVFNTEINIINVDDYEFLKSKELYFIVPWVIVEGNNYGSARISNELAIVNGLEFFSLKQTILDTHEWWYSDALTEDRRQAYEANPDTALARESELLEAWAAYSTSS
jgi:2'-hydroxyisoflavone reductase